MKRNSKKIIILILILSISIGFAYLSATLNIAGLIGYKGNSWNIYFDNVQIINNIEGTNKPTINNSKDEVNFSVSMGEPSELYEFSIDVVNDGTIDAMIDEIIKTGINSNNSEYLDYTVTYINGNNLTRKDLLTHGSRVRLDIKVSYKYETTTLADVGTNNFSLSVKYIQASDDANPVDNYYESDSNNEFTLFNAKANTLSNLKIYGDISQKQYQGYQLLKNDGLSTPFSNTSFWNNHNNTSVSSNGWLHVSLDNTNGTDTKYANCFIYLANVDYELDTDYTIYVEYKNYTGTDGAVTINQGRAVEPFASSSNSGHLTFDSDSTDNHATNTKAGTLVFLVHTRSSFDGVTLALRGFSSCPVGSAYSVDLRMTIVKGNTRDTLYSWEPYVGGVPSPNPNYPQDVKGVTGTNTIKISGKNLLKFTGTTKTTNGITYTVNDDGSVTINGTNDTQYPSIYNFSTSVPLKANTKYYFNGKTVSNNSYIVECNYKNNGAGAWSAGSFTTVEATNANCYISVRIGKTVDNVVIEKEHFFLEENDHFTGYEDYKEKTITLNLGNLNVYKIDDYKDYIYNKDSEWYVHRNIGVYDMSIPTSWYRSSTNSLERYAFVNQFVPDYYPRYKLYSTHFRYNSSLSNKTGYVGFVSDTTNNILYFDFAAYNTTTTEDFKNWCVANNPKIYFRLNTPYDEKITDTNLINQLNSLLNNNIYDGTNFITVSSSGLVPVIEFDYVHE